jgi:hypothetical protein
LSKFVLDKLKHRATPAVKEGALSFSWKLKTPSRDFENCYTDAQTIYIFTLGGIMFESNRNSTKDR